MNDNRDESSMPPVLRQSIHEMRTELNSGPEGLDAFNIEVTKDAESSISMSINSRTIYLRAVEAQLSFALGQTNDAELFLYSYEYLRGTEPASDRSLELVLSSLRQMVSWKKQHFHHAAAWSLNILRLNESLASDPIEPRALSLARLAADASSMGLKNSAAKLYAMARIAAERPEDHAQVSAREAAFRFNRGEVETALRMYLEAYEQPDLERAHPLQQCGTAARIADCLRTLGRDAEYWRYTLASLTHLDAARSQGYDSIGGIESFYATEIAWTSRSIHSQATSRPTAEIALALGLMSNNSMAAAIRSRSDRTEAGFRREFIAANLALKWSLFSEADVSRMLDTTIVPTATIDAHRAPGAPLRGTSLTILPGSEPIVHSWELSASEDDFVQGLMQPPSDDLFNLLSSPWMTSASNPTLNSLTEKIFPAELVELLRAGTIERLHIQPLFSVWKIPFSALAIDGIPLGARTVLTFSTFGAQAISATGNGVWSAHFDTNLAFVEDDASNFEHAATAASARLVPMRDYPSENRPSFVAFGGHGRRNGLVLDSSQALHEDNVLTTHSFPAFEPGALIYLNACWAARTDESIGKDNISFALSLLELGAHTVISTIGPVRDDVASELFRDFLQHLPSSKSPAHALRAAIAAVLLRNPDAPLADWAVYACLSVPEQAQ